MHDIPQWRLGGQINIDCGSINHVRHCHYPEVSTDHFTVLVHATIITALPYTQPAFRLLPPNTSFLSTEINNIQNVSFMVFTYLEIYERKYLLIWIRNCHGTYFFSLQER